MNEGNFASKSKGKVNLNQDESFEDEEDFHSPEKA